MIFSTSLFSTDYYYYRFRYEVHELTINGVKANYPVVMFRENPHVFKPNKPGEMLQSVDVISAIDGVSTKNLSYDEVFKLFESKASATFSIIRWATTLDIKLTGLPCTCHPSRVVSEHELRYLLHNCPYDNSDDEYLKYNVYRDASFNLYKYNTYDIEFSDGGCSPTDKKKFANELIGQLAVNGLKQDTENPQMLFVIEIYANKKEQYIPPTSSVNTQYKYGYELFSGWGTRQYINTQQHGGYTEVSYLHKIRMTVMDVEKMKKKSSIPPVIWSTDWSEETSDPGSMEEVTLQNLWIMLWTLKPVPVKISFWCQDNPSCVKSDVQYSPVTNPGWYMNVYYDRDNPSIVAAVEPDGGGAKAGLIPGSKMITYCPVGYNNKVEKNIVSPIPSSDRQIKTMFDVYNYVSLIYWNASGWLDKFKYTDKMKITFENNGKKIKTEATLKRLMHSPAFESLDN